MHGIHQINSFSNSHYIYNNNNSNNNDEKKMASHNILTLIIIISTYIYIYISQITLAADPDILTDFISPPNSPPPNATFFTFTGFRPLVSAPVPPKFSAAKATIEQFPALNGQSVSYAALTFPPATANPVHTHPRAAELLLLTQGRLEVGFVDAANRLYTQTMEEGDLFVFPKGLVHFQYNADVGAPAFAISAFGSAAAGTVAVPGALFNSSVDDVVLALSFKTDVATIQKLKAGLKG